MNAHDYTNITFSNLGGGGGGVTAQTHVRWATGAKTYEKPARV